MVEYSSVISSKLWPKGTEAYGFEPIGFVRSPFKDKYGVPRQPSLAIAAKGTIQFRNDPDLVTALKSVESFTHLWVIFVFHEHGGKNWKPSIRPPRLGGREKVGVLASRSPHRPNPIGISVVKIDKINLEAHGGPQIEISGIDVVDGTPVLDVKPYIPYADAFPEASSGWAHEDIKKYPVLLSEDSQIALLQIQAHKPEFEMVMRQMLEIDPRPAYQQREHPIGDASTTGRRYGIKIMGVEVKYEMGEDCIRVLSLSRVFHGESSI